MINRFKKTGSKLQYFFRIQRCYFLLCSFCWILNITFLYLGSPTFRTVHAITKSIEPAVMSLPWLMSIVSGLFRSSRERVSESEMELLGMPQRTQSSGDAAMNKKTIDDAMRNEIVEYLLKGIRKSIISYAELNEKEFPKKEKGALYRLFMTVFGKCLRKGEDESSFARTGYSDLEAGNTELHKRVNLVNKKAIIREAKRKVRLLTSVASLQAPSRF